MEIRSNRLQPYNPVQQQTGRKESANAFKQQELSGQRESAKGAEYQPRQEVLSPSTTAELDYRQLVVQSRAQQNSPQQREAYRIADESHRVQQALGAYRNTAELSDSDSELMPRLDDYV